MADYNDITVTDAWVAVPAASEVVTLQARGGTIDITEHSAPDGLTQGVSLQAGIGAQIPANLVVRVRRSGHTNPTTIARTVIG